MESDDGQTWIGKGSFTENENRVQLRSYNLIRTVSHFSYDSSGNMTLKSLSRDSTLIHKYNFAKKKDNLGSIYLELKSKEQKIKIRYEKRISISYPNSIIKINSSVALPKNDWIPKRRDK